MTLSQVVERVEARAALHQRYGARGLGRDLASERGADPLMAISSQILDGDQLDQIEEAMAARAPAGPAAAGPAELTGLDTAQAVEEAQPPPEDQRRACRRLAGAILDLAAEAAEAGHIDDAREAIVDLLARRLGRIG